MTGPASGNRPPSPLIFLVAGEPSGDLLGARLMAALRAETGGAVRFAGIGGEHMVAQGLHSLVPITDLAVMGVFEILPHALRILRHIRTAAAAARAARPDAIVTIDSPSFSLEVSQRLRGLDVPLIHYVAPSVWAWKPWRAAAMARYLDHLLTLLPFEPPYFEKHGLATTFVGHPAIEMASRPTNPAAFRARHGIPAGAPVVCVLPGSRRGEVRRLAPLFGTAMGMLSACFPDLRAVVPTVATVAAEVTAATAFWPVPTVVLTDPDDKYEAFAASTAALAASGTVAVELAVAGVPTVVAYRVSALTAFVARRVVKVRYVSLPNILLDRAVQPELLQADCTPAKLAAALATLLADPAARAAQIAAAREAVRLLDPGAVAPSRRAAQVVLSLIAAGPARRKDLKSRTIGEEKP
jgi:lipid-A-disaccharide synthase